MAKRLFSGSDKGDPHSRGSESCPIVKAALTPAQVVDFEVLRDIVKNMARHRQLGATSDHADFYDENGLPA